MSETYFKVLGQNGSCCHGGAGSWSTNGEWMPTVHGNLAPCTRGYHLCRANDLVEWLGPVIWIADGRGKSFQTPQHLIFQEARVVRPIPSWTPKVARQFAAECAERVLPLLEAQSPHLTTPRLAIQAAREFSGGTVDFETMADCAHAAWQASRQLDGGLRDVAVAAYGAGIWEQDGMAAWAAAGSARTASATQAREAALAFARENNLHPREAERKGETAGVDAWHAERNWQTKRLFQLLGTF
ncbi:MAG: hypothetical protein HQM02_02110 [Magnetococcales bacterium]|nr:hypothetical protein [Magnetococcales bacterium]